MVVFEDMISRGIAELEAGSMTGALLEVSSSDSESETSSCAEYVSAGNGISVHHEQTMYNMK
jgi:hypothetical protein